MMAVEAGTTTEVFAAFRKDELLPKLEPGTTLVMDNLGAHRTKPIRELLADHDIKVRYTPTYSLEYNSIELWWHWLKQRLRTWGARNSDALDHAVGEAMRQLPANIARNWLAHKGFGAKCYEGGLALVVSL